MLFRSIANQSRVGASGFTAELKYAMAAGSPPTQTILQLSFMATAAYPIKAEVTIIPLDTKTNDAWITEKPTDSVSAWTSMIAENNKGVRLTQQPAPSGNTTTLNVSDANLQRGNIFIVAPNQNMYISLANAAVTAGTLKEFEVHVVQGATLYAIGWTFTVTWLSGSPPTFNAGKTGVCVFRATSSGIIGNFAYEQ